MNSPARSLAVRFAIGTLMLTAFSNLSVAAGWVGKFPPNSVTPVSDRRNHVFYVGEPVVFMLAGKRLDRYEVRDYWGTLIDQGPATDKITLKAQLPGWYKLYVYAQPKKPEKPKGELDSLLDDKKEAKPESTVKEAPAPAPKGPSPEELWGDIVGGTMFVIFRRDPHFPDMPNKEEPGGRGGDEVARGVTGMGPQRHSVDTVKLDDSIKNLEFDVAIDKKWYLPYDPARKRSLMVAFPNGTKDIDGVRRIVEHFKSDVQYWEPRNEPNYGSSGADFVVKEMRPFYDTIKAVDPKLKVMGPGTVAIGPQLQPWLEDFFKAGGARYIDVFSFHFYNGMNGDLWLARRSMDSLTALLKKYDVDGLEKWQTEQGYFACVYGAYQPRLQARWTMLEMMIFEQYGLPKEHNHLWYDVSHGFWDFPTWWENDDGSFNPAALLMRVWSEELFGKQFSKRLDFGPEGNRLYIGSMFSGAGKQVAAVMSAGSTDGKVPLKVTGAERLKLVSAFGVESELTVENGRALLPVCELPVYVELSEGQSIDVIPTAWGTNLARADGVRVSSSGKLEHPVDPKINNAPSKIVNGEFEAWYWSQQPDSQPWMSNVEQFPAWVEFELPKAQAVSRVVVFAAPPWQWQGSLLDYELQYDDGGKWVSIEHVQEPAQTFQVFTQATRTSCDSFYSERWIFQHEFPAITTAKLRLLVNDVTWGGGATEEVVKAGGQTGPHQIMLREVEIYGP
jgi:hypothetical protein